MVEIIGKHPSTVSFYSDLLGAGLIFFVVLAICLNAITTEPIENKLQACLPLSVVFAGLSVALAIRMQQ